MPLNTKISNARASVFRDITKLMEEAYKLGYEDGCEDTNNRHKQFVMATLKKDMETH